jgi:hypothetical protein
LPYYNFEDTNTGELIEKFMKISERDEFVKENPHLKQIITGAPMMVRNSSGGIKNDDGWKENLARIAEANPGSALAEKVGGRSTKEVKTREAAKKYGVGDKGKYSIDF